jgi:hypothetical protein
MARLHNELSQVVVTASPLDLQGDPYTPSNARYKVTDCASEDELVAWTSLTPSTAMIITVPGSANAIIRGRHKTETKVVTVQTDSGLDTSHYEEYEYKVKNLKFVT